MSPAHRVRPKTSLQRRSAVVRNARPAPGRAHRHRFDRPRPARWAALPRTRGRAVIRLHAACVRLLLHPENAEPSYSTPRAMRVIPRLGQAADQPFGLLALCGVAFTEDSSRCCVRLGIAHVHVRAARSSLVPTSSRRRLAAMSKSTPDG